MHYTIVIKKNILMYYKHFIIILLLNINICYSKSISNTNDTINNTYNWIVLELNKKELNPYIEKNKKFKKNELNDLFNLIIEHYENNGYPFSKIEFKTDSIKEYEIYGKLLFNKGKKTIIDSIAIKGYNKFPNYLIRRYIDIPDKSLFSQKKINNISKSISNINFIKEYKKNEILFNEQKNIIYLYLEKEKNNYLDAFIGLNNYNEKLIFLGKIDLNISNTFNLFENIELRWNKSDEKSQELNFKFKFPYIFNSIFGFTTKLNIIQFENIYHKREMDLLLNIQKKQNNISLGYLNKKSSVFTNTNSSQIRDFSSNFIKIIWEQKYEEKYKIHFSAGLGNSKIDTDILNRQHCKLSFNITIPLFDSNFIFFSSTNELLIGNNILNNEKIAIGGQTSLRGFLENSFFSKSFNIFNIENKYYIEKNTYISAFYDIGIIHDNQDKLISSVGLGLGLVLKNDIFSVNYAIPSQNNKFEIGDAKLHFNYLIKF